MDLSHRNIISDRTLLLSSRLFLIPKYSNMFAFTTISVEPSNSLYATLTNQVVEPGAATQHLHRVLSQQKAIKAKSRCLQGL